jgi:hypothetical protein
MPHFTLKIMNTDTPETDHIEKNLGNAAHPILSSFCRRLERERDEAREQRDSLAPSAWTLDWQAGPYPNTMRVVLATDGENIYVATYTKTDGWQDAYSGEPVDYYITYWCEIPALPQV